MDLSRLSGPAVARWFDPSSGAYTPIAGSPLTNSGTRNFTPPGNNNDGDGGWLLVLETNPPPNPPPPPPRPKFVQQNYSVPQSPQTQVSTAYPLPQQAGNANIVAIGWNDIISSISGVNDSAGNTYEAALSTFRGSGMSQAIYFCPNIKAGANGVTVTFSQPATFVDLRITEYSSLSHTNVFDAGSSGSGVGALANSGPVTAGVSNELLFAAGMTATTFAAPGAGFTQRILTSPDGDIVADQIASAPWRMVRDCVAEFGCMGDADGGIPSRAATGVIAGGTDRHEHDCHRLGCGRSEFCIGRKAGPCCAELDACH